MFFLLVIPCLTITEGFSNNSRVIEMRLDHTSESLSSFQLFIHSTEPVDSFELRISVSSTSYQIDEPITTEELASGCFYFHHNTEQSITAVYCSVEGFYTNDPILIIPIQICVRIHILNR